MASSSDVKDYLKYAELANTNIFKFITWMSSWYLE